MITSERKDGRRICNFIIFADSMKRTYASVVRGCNNIEDDRPRYQSCSSVDSGFEGLENIQPFDLEDIERYQKTR